MRLLQMLLAEIHPAEVSEDLGRLWPVCLSCIFPYFELTNTLNKLQLYMDSEWSYITRL